MTDPIADLLIRIKNAHMARHESVRIPFSKVKFNLANILQEEGYVISVEKVQDGQFPEIKVVLKYVGKVPAITDVRRLSKPGRRLYVPVLQIPRALGGYGITIISTSKGVMTDVKARKQNIGGELLCQVW